MLGSQRIIGGEVLKMVSKEKVIDYVVDTTVANMVGLVTVIPFQYMMGMDAANLWRVFVSFWTINWFTSFSIVWVLKRFREWFPHTSGE